MYVHSCLHTVSRIIRTLRRDHIKHFHISNINIRRFTNHDDLLCKERSNLHVNRTLSLTGARKVINCIGVLFNATSLPVLRAIAHLSKPPGPLCLDVIVEGKFAVDTLCLWNWFKLEAFPIKKVKIGMGRRRKKKIIRFIKGVLRKRMRFCVVRLFLEFWYWLDGEFGFKDDEIGLAVGSICLFYLAETGLVSDIANWTQHSNQDWGGAGLGGGGAANPGAKRK